MFLIWLIGAALAFVLLAALLHEPGLLFLLLIIGAAILLAVAV